jgi:hypothetical protein
MRALMASSVLAVTYSLEEILDPPRASLFTKKK